MWARFPIPKVFGIFREVFPPVDSVLPEEVADTLEMLWIHLLREIGDECGCHKFPDWGYFNSGVWPKGDYG